MTGGFSFCGVDIASLGIEYAPELEDTYVYKPAKARIHEETYDGHNGGYFYGMSREPKEFKLRCIFEENEIDRGIMAKMHHLFKEGKSGKLIFSRRPWCYYYATVTEFDDSEITNYLNGVIKITMKAYYPYGRSDTMVATPVDKDYFRIRENTAFFEDKAMIPPTQHCVYRIMTDATELLLANPGTESAHVGIEIAGNVGDGVIITNHTTGQICKFVAMSDEVFDGGDCYLYLDGMNGKCVTVNNGVAKETFLYHDEGFIQLAPAYPMMRDMLIVTGDNEINVINKLYDRNAGDTREEAEAILKGQYIWIDNKWHEITGVGKDLSDLDIESQADGVYQNEHLLYVNDTIEEGISERTCICQLNKITVEPISTMKLTRLNFIYKPTFS